MQRKNSNVVQNGLVPLNTVGEGTDVVIRSFDGGHAFLARIAALGLIPGSEVRVLANRGRGPVLLHARDTRVAVGRGMANKILVELKSAS
jgi:Fe2+ transport system protein FeoA